MDRSISNAPRAVAGGCGCVDRRMVLRGLVCTALVPTALVPTALAPTALYAADNPPPQADDIRFMRMALAEAARADFPFGAVIVRDGDVIARGRNLGRTRHDPTAHGEMVAIRNAVAGPGSKALRGATLYTTGEPCAMCMGAIIWCHIGRVVFAASVEQLATVMDQIMITGAEIAARASFAPMQITGGVLADEAMVLFRKKR